MEFFRPSFRFVTDKTLPVRRIARGSKRGVTVARQLFVIISSSFMIWD
jgi:hypothetical protein